jgi:hypothetical protein
MSNAEPERVSDEQTAEELAKVEAEPFLPAEKKLVAGSLILGFLLLGLLLWAVKQ